MSDKQSWRAGIVQCLASLAISFVTCLTGLVFAWPSYNVVNFTSNSTVLSEPMSSLHISLLGSLTNISAFIMTPLCGIALDRIGRKYLAILIGVPYVITWIIIAVTNNINWILVSMFTAGFGIAGQAISSIYIAEIVHDSIRGGMTSLVVMVYFFGLLVSYTLGGVFSYMQVVYIHLALSVLYIVMVAVLKESPVFLLQKGREKEAAESIAFYRQTSPTSKEVEVEIAKIKLQLDPNLEKMLEEEEDPTVTKELMTKTQPERKLTQWQFFKQSQSSIRAFFAALVCMATMILMGNIAIQVYAETLFREATPSLNANKCSIFLGIVFLAASAFCLVLIDRLGRKFLMISTCIGSSICTLALAIQIQFQWAPDWFTAVLIYAYNFIFNAGVAVIPYVFAAELFLPEVRGLCGGMVMSAGWFLNFITMVVFTPVVEEYGFGPLFYAFTVIGFAGAIYCMYYLPETKGLSVDAIQSLFLKKTKRKVGA